MTASMPWVDALFGDPEIAALWSPENQWAHIAAFEIAWSEGLAVIGHMTQDDAADAIRQIEAFEPDDGTLAAATARDGVVVPEIVRQLRQNVQTPDAIHTGATSQDVLDTALVLTLRQASNVLERRLNSVLQTFDRLTAQFGDRTMMGRTRMQAAHPIAASHRIGAWRNPLAAQLARLPERRAAIERLQYGGATGERSSLGEKSAAMAAHLGGKLDLTVPDKSWHTDRTALADYAAWLTITVSALGKIGMDIGLMAQQGIDEITLSGGGRSSAMPHKQNPVNAELLVALARHATGLNSTMQASVLHEQERSGSAWMLEWLTLPQLTATTGRALTCAQTLLDQIEEIGTSV